MKGIEDDDARFMVSAPVEIPIKDLFDLLIESTVAELTLTVSQYMQAPPHSDMHCQSFSLAQTSHICVK